MFASIANKSGEMQKREQLVSSGDLSLLIAVIEEGSLSAAGLTIGLSTAMVSRRLQAIEDRLGIRLVARTSRSLRPTDEGADLYERGKRILADLGEACESVMADGSSLSGTVRLLVPLSFGRRQIAPMVGAFCVQNPKIRVEMDLADRSSDMTEGGYDLQISIGQPIGDSLITRRLMQRRRAVCASPEFWHRAGLPQRPEDLRDMECILLRRGRAPMDRWCFRTDAGLRKIEVSGRLSSNSGEITHAWALAGLGVVLKSLWDVEDDLRSGALVEVFPDLIHEQSDIYVCYPTRNMLTKRTRALVDYLVAALSGPSTI